MSEHGQEKTIMDKNSYCAGGNDTLLNYVLIAIIVIALMTNIYWIVTTSNIMGNDSGYRLSFAFNVYGEFKAIMANGSIPLIERLWGVLKLPFSNFPFLEVNHPVFLYGIMSFFYYVLGTHLAVIKLLHMGFFLILAGGLYALGARMLSRSAGLLAVALLSLYPFVFQLVRQYGVDVPFTAVFVLSFLFLLKTEEFSLTRYSVLLGLGWGVGLLIKGQMLFLFAPIWGIVLIQALVRQRANGKRRIPVIANGAVAAGLALLVGGIWWGDHFGNACRVFMAHVDGNVEWRDLSHYGRLWFYMKRLIFDATGAPLFLLFLYGSVKFFRDKRGYRYAYAAALLVPMLFFTFVIWISDIRHVLPVMPFVALMTAYGILTIRATVVRTAVMAGALVFAFMQFVFITAAGPSLLASLGEYSIISGGQRESEWMVDKNNMREAEMVYSLLQNRAHTKKVTNVLAIMNDEKSIRSIQLRFWLMKNDISLRLDDVFYSPRFDMTRFEYIIVRVPARSMDGDWFLRSYLEKKPDLMPENIWRRIRQKSSPYIEQVFQCRNEFALIARRRSLEREDMYWLVYQRVMRPGVSRRGSRGIADEIEQAVGNNRRLRGAE